MEKSPIIIVLLSLRVPDRRLFREFLEDLRREEISILPIPVPFFYYHPWHWREWLERFPEFAVDWGEWEYFLHRWYRGERPPEEWRHELYYMLRRLRDRGEPRALVLLVPFADEHPFLLSELQEFVLLSEPAIIVDLRIGEAARGIAERMPNARLMNYPENRSELFDLLRPLVGERPPSDLERISARHELARHAFAERTAQQERPKITVAYPEAVAPFSWSTMEVFVYVRDYRELVEKEIGRLEDREGVDYSGVSSEFPKSLPPGCPIRISLQSDSLRTNPSELTINWYEPYNRLPFRISPVHPTKVGYSASLDIDVFADDLPVASMRFAIAVNSNARGEHVTRAASEAAWYEDIFASYAREDRKLVRHLKERYEALGLYMFVDLDDLRSGSLWRTALFQKIDDSDLFQLFWSEHARQSQYVAVEWKHALGVREVKGARFIRPVYWHEPITPIPEELAEINFRKITFVESGGAEPKDAVERG